MPGPPRNPRRDEAVDRIARGESYTAVAADVGVHRTLVTRWAHAANVARVTPQGRRYGPQDRIAAFAALRRTGSFKLAAQHSRIPEATIRRWVRRQRQQELEETVGSRTFRRNSELEGRVARLRIEREEANDALTSSRQLVADQRAEINRLRATGGGTAIDPADLGRAEAKVARLRRRVADLESMLRAAGGDPEALDPLTANGRSTPLEAAPEARGALPPEAQPSFTATSAHSSPVVARSNRNVARRPDQPYMTG